MDSSKLESKRKVITINAELTIIATRLTPNCRNYGKDSNNQNGNVIWVFPLTPT